MEKPYTHTTWRVRAGSEDEFVRRWSEWVDRLRLRGACVAVPPKRDMQKHLLEGMVVRRGLVVRLICDSHTTKFTSTRTGRNHARGLSGVSRLLLGRDRRTTSTPIQQRRRPRRKSQGQGDAPAGSGARACRQLIVGIRAGRATAQRPACAPERRA